MSAIHLMTDFIPSKDSVSPPEFSTQHTKTTKMEDARRYWAVFTPTTNDDWKLELNKIVENNNAQMIVCLDLPHKFRADFICNDTTWQQLKNLPQFKSGSTATVWKFE